MNPVVEEAVPDEAQKLTIHIKVYSPFKTYFDEEAFSITAVNGTGPFDVLPKHHNFMTLLNPCEMVIQRESGPVRIRIARGIMHVKADKVVVFLDV
jgi:F0F1-type ATP synthase epsilon subunit